MALTKTELLKIIEGLPDTVTIEDVMAELYARSKIEAGLRDLDNGHGVPHSEVVKKIEQWRS